MLGNLKDKAKAKYDNFKNKDKDKDKHKQQEGQYEEMNEEEKSHVDQKHQAGGGELGAEKKEIEIDPKRKPSKLDIVKGKLNDAGSFLTEKASNLKKGAKDSFSAVDKSVKDQILKRKQQMNQWIAIKADEKVVSTMAKMEPKLVASFEDSKMPGCVRRFVEEMVLNLWRDVTDMMRFELRISLQKPELQLSKRPDKYCCLKPWYIFRNWYLYATNPFNKSFWEKASMKSFIFFKILQSIPTYGIQAVMFFLLFLAIDKSEEFQLVNFILGYKNIQFLTAGCLNAIIGYFQYFYCATIQPSEQAKDLFLQQGYSGRSLQQATNTTVADPYAVLNSQFCFTDGPGSQLNLVLDVSSFFFQIILIWIAYFALYCSSSRVDFIEEKMKIKKDLRGGRLTYFMVYDLFAFTGTLVFGGNLSQNILLIKVLTYYHIYYLPGQPAKLYVETAGLIYFCKMLYGLLSLPFLIFSVGFFVKLFTSAKPTGYDKFGNVVPVLDKIKLVYEQLPPGEDEEIDIGELIG